MIKIKSLIFHESWVSDVALIACWEMTSEKQFSYFNISFLKIWKQKLRHVTINGNTNVSDIPLNITKNAMSRVLLVHTTMLGVPEKS